MVPRQSFVNTNVFYFQKKIYVNKMLVIDFFAEFFGTMIFLLIVVGLVLRNNKDPIKTSGLIPLIIGLGLATSIFIAVSLGSPGHLNPVVTLVMGAHGKISKSQTGVLIGAQILGAIVAFSVWFVISGQNEPAECACV